MKQHLFAFASAITLLGATSAHAQEATSGTIEEIVVTARRVEENLQSVPVAVSAISGANLERRSVRDVRDVALAVPNIQIQPHSINPTSVNIAIRGQTAPDLVLTVDPTVGLYVDGVNYPRTLGMRANMIDIERVEVLRGPQGTLYGRNTTGGAFSVITRSPVDSFGASISGVVGNYETYGATGVVNLPLAEGLAARFVGAYSDRNEGFATDARGHELATERSRMLRGKLKWEPVESVSLTLSADYQTLAGGGVITRLGGPVTAGGASTQYERERGLPTSAGPAAMTAEGFRIPWDRSGGDYTDGVRFEGYGYSLDAQVSLTSAWDVRSITSWRRFETQNQQDLDATTAAVLNSGNFEFPSWDRNFTQELQLLFNGETLSGVVGAYYSDERGRDTASSITIPLVTRARNINDSIALSESAAVFGQATWRLQPDWSLTAGLRYTREKKGMINRNRAVSTVTGVTTCNVPAALQDTPGLCQTTLSDEFKKPSWVISLDHNLTDRVMVYGKASRGFRSGGQNIRGSGLVASFQPFRPEIATEYELGWKSDLLERTVRFNAALFYNELQDVQRSVLVLAPNGATVTVMTNAASATLYGGEVEAVWRANPNLEFSGGLGYTHAEYDRFVDFTGDRSGEAWPAPKLQANLSARYTTDTPWGALALQGDLYHQSDIVLSPVAKRAHEVTQKGYVLGNARVSLSIGGETEVAAFVRNITDEKIITTAVNLESLGYNLVMPGEPRTFGIEVKKRFGSEVR